MTSAAGRWVQLACILVEYRAFQDTHYRDPNLAGSQISERHGSPTEVPQIDQERRVKLVLGLSAPLPDQDRTSRTSASFRRFAGSPSV
jgi:hypothetical protein